MFASVTRLRVRSAKYLPEFPWKTFLIQRQAERAPGFLDGKLLVDADRVFWTLTIWEDDRAMKAFRGASSHAASMPRLLEWCDEASYAHWTQTDASAPAWEKAHEHLVAEGRLSRVAHPSPAHEARRFSRPRLSPLIQLNLKRTRPEEKFSKPGG